jgi:LysR family transcriptional regulator, cyn operon transcriptional activator
VAQEQGGLSAVRLTPAIDSRRVALLQRRGGYRRAASRAFVAVAKDYTKIEGGGRRRDHRNG